MRDRMAGRTILARLASFGVGCSIFLLAVIAVLVGLQVFARNFLDLGLPWADELARFASIGLVFLAMPCLAGRQALVSVSTLPDALGESARRWAGLIADLATLAFAGLMLWGFAQFLPRAIAADRVVNTLRGRNPTDPYHDPRDDSGLPI